MKTKRILAALLAVTMVLTFSFTGCGGGSGKNGIGDPTDPNFLSKAATGEYSDGIMLPELVDPNFTVLMSIDWSYLEENNSEKSPLQQYYATLIWQNAYDIVPAETIVTITEDQQTDSLATMTAAGEAPDIIPCNEATYPRWNANGLTAPMEDYFGYLGWDVDGLYNKTLCETFKWGGKIHGLVTLKEANKNYTIYNKSKFESAAETNPMEHYQKGNWNWTQFVKTAKNMTKGDDYGFTGWALFPYCAPYPMAVINDDNTASLNIDDPKYMRYMTEVYNFYQKDKCGRLSWDLQSWATLFPQGTDAMVMADIHAYQRIVKQAKKLGGDTFGIAPCPIFDPNGETKPIAAANMWAYSIAAAARNPEAAACYIRCETEVMRNIEKAQQGNSYLDSILTDEEKAMIEAEKDSPILVDPIRGIGDCYLGIIDASIIPAFYYTETDQSVQAIFDTYKPQLQAEFDEFNEMAKEASAEAAS